MQPDTSAISKSSYFAGLTASELTAFINDASSGRAHLKSIAQAIRDAGLVHSLILRGEKYPPLPKRLRSRPVLFVVGDDLYTAMGPDAFHRKSLRRAFRGVRLVVIHCAEASAQHYDVATAVALAAGKSIIIESQPSHEKEWLAFVGHHAPQASIIMVTPNCASYSYQQGNA